MDIPEFQIQTIAIAALLAFGGALLFSAVLGGVVLWRVRKIQLPPDADFFTAIRLTPLVVVLLLDLLDFTLDFLSAPVAWLLLTRLGLGPLRGVTVVESDGGGESDTRHADHPHHDAGVDRGADF
jgi:hypothetical protein